MKLSLSDFQNYLSNDDLLCIKTIVDIDYQEKFIEDKVYSPIRVTLNVSGKYDDKKRCVTVCIFNEKTRCCFTEYGLNAEELIFNILKSCFIPLSTVISVFRSNNTKL